MKPYIETMSTNVAVQKCDEYQFDSVYNSVKKLLELVPPPDVTGKTVLLKPNILYPKKVEDAVCTHPVVVGACVKAFIELGAKEVYLYITHCENTIFEGEIFTSGLIEKVYTTNSILRKTNEKIEVFGL